MTWALLVNDDGVDSPVLLPFADALEEALGLPVRVCVPDRERSWSSKAISRHGPVALAHVRRGGRLVTTCSGTPADATQLGLYAAFAAEHAGAPPLVVVSGINVGYNHGSAFLACSGTVWAAAEAALAGLPAVAVSVGDDVERRHRSTPAGAAAWVRVARAGAAAVRAVGDSPVHGLGDLVTVNMPWEATVDTPRRLTSLDPLSYGPLFAPTGDAGTFGFTDDLLVDAAATPGSDIAVTRAGEVAVTPLTLPRGAAVPDDVRAAFEGGVGDTGTG